MSWKDNPKLIELVAFFVFCFLVSIGIWFRKTLFGFDSYAHLNAICFGFWEPLNTAPVANMIFSWFPCSVLFINFFMLSAFFVSMLGIFYLVKHFFDERLAWLSCFLVIGLSPVVLFSFFEFENELLAYPFIVWGIYFLLKWEGVNKLWALVCFCFSLLFWKWIWYLTFIQRTFSVVLEMNLFHGILDLWFLLPFVIVIVLLLKKNKWLLGFALISVALWLWNAKLWIFLLPTISLSVANLIYMLENSIKLKKSKILSPNHLKYLYLLGFVCLVGFNASYWLQSPNSTDWELVNKAILESQDQNVPLYPDLGWDYWVVSKTGKESFKYQQLWGDLNMPRPYVWLTSQDSNCTLIEKRTELAKKKYIYYCD